jgi:hypothetical protein
MGASLMSASVSFADDGRPLAGALVYTPTLRG